MNEINNFKSSEISNDSYDDHLENYLSNNVNYSLRI